MQSGKSVKVGLRENTRHKTAGVKHKEDTEERRGEGATRRVSVSPCLRVSVSLPGGVVLTFGVFDGVHVAHQIVISRVVNRARELGIHGVVVSFDPHPAFSISGEMPPILTITAEKIGLLKTLGINRVIVEDFNEQFSQLSPEEFVRGVLVDRFHAQEIVVGYDCAFGKARAGDRWLLKELGEKYGFTVDVVEPYRLNGAVVSSTRIRTAILKGDLDLARKLLGRHFGDQPEFPPIV